MATQLENSSEDYESSEITVWSKLVEKYDQIPEKYHEQDPAYKQAEEISPDIESELGERRDLRDLPTVTIDPDYAHDHDDAVSLLEDGGDYRAFVHIADVAHYVESGSSIDEAAKDRGVTFYLGDNTRHMLPRRLAQDICSVSPGSDSLAHTVEMKMDREGQVKDFGVYKSVIESNAHLTYTHSDTIIDNSEEIIDHYVDNPDSVDNEDAQTFRDIARSLDNLDSLTQNMRDDRWDKGLIINKDTASSRVVEEMMVAANETVGDYLREEEIGLYRVEDTPVKGWTDEVKSELAELGYEIPSRIHQNSAEALNNFFADTVEDDDRGKAEKIVVTKLPRAKYESRGKRAANHFGLGTTDYAHFTSPIRRYTDLVNHRIVAGALSDMERMQLPNIAERVSNQQEEADNAAEDWYDANT